MSDNRQETVEDIVAKMRQRIAVKMSDAWYTQAEWRNLCDRIEAAIERDRTSRHSIKIPIEVVPELVGNGAATREALVELTDKVLDYLHKGLIQLPLPLENAIAKARAALAAPPRNCDLARDWLQDLYCKFKPPATVRREMPPEWVDAIMAFCQWLLAPAAERKGEGDGR